MYVFRERMNFLFTQNKNQIITLFEKAVFFFTKYYQSYSLKTASQFIIFFLHLRLIHVYI